MVPSPSGRIPAGPRPGLFGPALDFAAELADFQAGMNPASPRSDGRDARSRAQPSRPPGKKSSPAGPASTSSPAMAHPGEAGTAVGSPTAARRRFDRREVSSGDRYVLGAPPSLGLRRETSGQQRRRRKPENHDELAHRLLLDRRVAPRGAVRS